MNFTHVLEEGGVPGVLLTLYLAVLINTFYPSYSQVWLGIYSFLGAFSVVFAVAAISDHISVLLAWDILEELDDTLKKEDTKRFYFQREKKKDTVDKHDNAVYVNQIAIFGGIIGVFTLPVIFHFRLDWPFSLASLPLVVVIFYFFIYQQVYALRNTIMLTEREYE
jgi:hypothetical protein